MKKIIFLLAIFALFFTFNWCTDQEKAEKATEQNQENNSSPYYITKDFYNMESSWSLHILSQYTSYQQTEEYSCWCAAVLWALKYYWIDEYDEMTICSEIWTSVLTWTSPDWIISFINKIWLNIFTHAADDYFFSTPEDFEDYIIVKLDSWFVTLVDWLDWWWHWQAIIWLDTMWTEDLNDDVLIMADPADDTDHNKDWYYITPLTRFFYMREEWSFTETKYKQPFISIFPKW